MDFALVAFNSERQRLDHMFYIGLEPFTYKYVKLLIGVMVFLSTASELSPKSGRIQDPLNFKITISGSFLIFSQPVIVVVLDATGVAFAANSACMFNFDSYIFRFEFQSVFFGR